MNLASVSLSKCEPAYYLNLNVNSAVKGHKDTTKICELQAANWYRVPNWAPLKVELHAYGALITQTFLQSCISLTALRFVVFLHSDSISCLISELHRDRVEIVVATGFFSCVLWQRYEL